MLHSSPETSVRPHPRSRVTIVGALMSLGLVTACGEQDMVHDPIIIEGSVPSPNCDTVAPFAFKGDYTTISAKEFKQVKRAASEMQRETCEGSYKVARKIVKLYKQELDDPQDSVTIYSELNQSAGTIRLHTVIDNDSLSERGGAVEFKLGKNGEPNYRHLLSLTTWARSGDNLQPINLTTDYSDDKGVVYKLQDVWAAGSPSTVGYCAPPVDTTSIDSFGWSDQPTLRQFEIHIDEVQLLTESMADMVTLDTKRTGCQ